MWRRYFLTWYHLGAKDWFQVLFKGKGQQGGKPGLLGEEDEEEGRHKKGKSEAFGFFTSSPSVDPSCSFPFKNLSVITLGKTYNSLSCLVVLDFDIQF